MIELVKFAVAAVLIALGLSTFAGCESSPSHDSLTAAERVLQVSEPWVQPDDDAARPNLEDRHDESVTLMTPRLRKLYRNRALASADDRLPWYAARNDALPSTYAGFQSRRVEEVHRFTRDRFDSFGGRVHDNYNRTTYRHSYQQRSF